MQVAQVIESRREQWKELETLCALFEHRRHSTIDPTQVVRFATLYRSACADLALADAHHLPPMMVQYLHQLVGRAHNQMYRGSGFDYVTWGRMLFTDVPRRVFRDGCVQIAFVLFWGIFILAMILAANDSLAPDFALRILKDDGIHTLETNFEKPIAGRDPRADAIMAGFYIQHNTSIGLRCFVGGLMVIPGILITAFNALQLGAAFGYMARPDVPAGINFFHFVTAHGPFELTAIVLSAGAGLRLGMAWIKTNGLARLDALRKTANEAMPIMAAAMILFFLAALIEGFLSPSAAPYAVKAAVALTSSGLLMFYFVVLGYPREDDDGTR
jgi:uncharacterized membrane protein SpoIIM required for sporulation